MSPGTSSRAKNDSTRFSRQLKMIQLICYLVVGTHNSNKSNTVSSNRFVSHTIDILAEQAFLTPPGSFPIDTLG